MEKRLDRFLENLVTLNKQTNKQTNVYFVQKYSKIGGSIY